MKKKWLQNNTYLEIRLEIFPLIISYVIFTIRPQFNSWHSTSPEFCWRLIEKKNWHISILVEWFKSTFKKKIFIYIVHYYSEIDTNLKISHIMYNRFCTLSFFNVIIILAAHFHTKKKKNQIKNKYFRQFSLYLILYHWWISVIVWNLHQLQFSNHFFFFFFFVFFS